jgi:hypothetical protein
MRTATVWTLGTVLLLGLSAAPGLAQEASPDPTPKGNWFSRWFGPTKKAEAPKVEATMPVPTHPEYDLETQVAIRTREKAVLDRRQEVCYRLRQIAYQTGDKALERMADQLDERAFALYQQRTGLPVGGFQSDEHTLAGRLGGPTPAGQVPANFAARAPDTASGQATARREQP